MKVGIVGAGKVGHALGIGLMKKGIEISGLYSRSQDSFYTLNTSSNGSLENSLVNTVVNSDVIFITTSDQVIKDMALRIARLDCQIDWHAKTFLHCSGALTSEELGEIREKGAEIGSFHPIQTFANKQTSWMALEMIYFGFEGTAGAKLVAEKIAHVFQGTLLMVEKDAKELYHAAACILSNYTVTLSYIAEKLFAKAGISQTEGLKGFMPLVERTIANIKESGSVASLTGPVSRGDVETIERHLEKIKAAAPQYLEVYSALGVITADTALEKGSIEEEAAKSLKQTLQRENELKRI